MSRLTKKDYKEWVYEVGTTINQKASEHLNYINHKLGKLEDIEDDLGCPLEVREKTLDTFYCPEFEKDNKLLNYYVYAFNNEELFIRLIYSQYDEYYNEETTISLDNYKKTWWLSKEECEG